MKFCPWLIDHFNPSHLSFHFFFFKTAGLQSANRQTSQQETNLRPNFLFRFLFFEKIFFTSSSFEVSKVGGVHEFLNSRYFISIG